MQPARLRPHRLDSLFASATCGTIPTGRSTGTALIAPGSPVGPLVAALARWLWRGKEFTPGTSDQPSELVNLLGPTGVRAVRAQVFSGPSWVDGEPCIVLDYGQTSWIARWIRDEIRQVGTGNYLGVVFVGRRKLPVRFWLTFPSAPTEGTASASATQASSTS